MARAARRKRPKDDDDREDKKKSAPPTKAEVAKVEAPTDAAPTENANEEKTANVADLIPIGERKPKNPLGEAARRKMAFENLEKVADAMSRYVTKTRGFPPRAMVTGSGIKTLSWRVALLPYLGYEELFKKFDPKVPWNKEPNKSLLQYIPDCYVSPERFDTKTNLQTPADRRFIFGLDRSRRVHAVEDGLENTIMLIEVSDSLADEWTRPTDFAPKDIGKIREEIGGLRKDGTFAAWANGWPVLLASGLSNDELLNAFTFDAGDGQVAGKIHREIGIDDIADAAVASTKQADTPSPAAVANSSSSSSAGPKEQVAPTIKVVREPIPNASQLAEAQVKLRKVYSDQLREAKNDTDKEELARTMIHDAGVMEDDPAGAYALQTASMRMSVDAGGPTTLISAIDQRVGRFEVDAYEENVQWLLSFGESLAGRDPASVEGKEFLTRAPHVILAGVMENDFMRASAVARIAYRLTGQSREEEIPRLLNRLRTQIAAAQKEFSTAKESLDMYRNDPENVDAGAAWGRFLCFIKGDWGTGLPLIAVGGSEEVRAAAKLDLRGADGYSQQVAIADSWWALSRRARGSYRQGAQDRAVDWYKQAFEVMPDSLDRMHVKNRIQEAEDEEGRSPLAILTQLAESVGVDLSVSLADMGYSRLNSRTRSGRRGSRNDDDDDD